MTTIKVIVNGEEVAAPGPASFEALLAVTNAAIEEIRRTLLVAAAESSAALAGYVTMPEDSKE